jgi:subtilase family serine protease
MTINPILRVVRALFLWSLGFLVLSQAAMAAHHRHSVAPFLVAGPQATPSGTTAGTVGAQYGLFTCQVIGLSPSTTCYDPYQMRAAYQVDSLINVGYNGAGHTIVIIDAFQSPNIVQELNTYNGFYGLPSLNGLGGAPNPLLGTFTQVAPDGLTPFITGNADMTGWAEEISLDVLWAHAIAPGANVVLVLAKSDHDVDIQSALQYAVDNNLGDIISMSFGENESCVDPDILAQQHDAFAAATLKGITLFASAGDDGAGQPSCDGSTLVQAVSSPASDPLVTGVGGTELHAARYCLAALGCNPSANPAFGTWQGEVVWNEDALGRGATGGGFSVVFDEPPYQKGTGGLHGGKQRAVPDVGYNAAVGHGVLTYLNIPGLPAGMYLFGGTSAGSPQWSAITAIANQKAGGRLGFINSAIYQIGKVNKAYPASFHDITVGDNSVDGVDGFDAGSGWDATTGTGSPMDVSLVDNLIRYVSPGDGNAAVATTKPKPNQKPIVPGHMEPH